MNVATVIVKRCKRNQSRVGVQEMLKWCNWRCYTRKAKHIIVAPLYFRPVVSTVSSSFHGRPM